MLSLQITNTKSDKITLNVTSPKIEIEQTLSQMKNCRASKYPSEMIKFDAEATIRLIRILLNECLSSGHISVSW